MDFRWLSFAVSPLALGFALQITPLDQRAPEFSRYLPPDCQPRRMNATRTVWRLLVGLAMAMVFIAPAAAAPSVNAELINSLNDKLLYAAIPITLLVEGILIYTVYRFRGSDGAKPTQENRRLEITWTVATAIILLFVGLASYQVLASGLVGGVTATSPNENVEGLSHDYSGAKAPAESNALQIEVIAQKYSWTFNYIEADGDVTSTNTLVIPKDRPVYLHITSIDWLHSFHAPKLGLKQDAIPNKYNTMKTIATQTGTYQLYCAEYCGVGHSNMLGTIEVKSQAEYQKWLDQQQQQSSGGGGNGSANQSTGGNSSNSSE